MEEGRIPKAMTGERKCEEGGTGKIDRLRTIGYEQEFPSQDVEDRHK